MWRLREEEDRKIESGIHFPWIYTFISNKLLFSKFRNNIVCFFWKKNSLHRSILIPVLLYGWQDDNVVEEEDTNDGDDISSQAPFWKSIVPTRNLHLGWDEEDQPDHDGPGQSMTNKREQTWRNPERSLQLRQLSVWRTSRRSWRRRCWTSSGQTRRKVQRYFPAEETYHLKFD